MERRHFLTVTAAGTIGLSLSGAGWLPTGEPSLLVLARPELLTLLNGRTVADIGMAYRATHRHEDAADRIASAIIADAKLSVDLTNGAVGERLAEQIRNDFANHRTVQLKGWILSLTEARQCALYSIASGRSL